MSWEVVTLEVIATIPISCDFWSQDDGWQGLCKSLSLTVSGSSFEGAKKNVAGRLLGLASHIPAELAGGQVARRLTPK